jgi:hypothetical protein
MGNRCVIATEKKDLAVYLHWNGGRDSVEAFLEYCRRMNFRTPESDCYGWARLVQVIANYFGGDGLSVGIDTFKNLDGAGDDNGNYIIRDWKIVAREHFDGPEQNEYPLEQMLKSIEDAQPDDMKLPQPL